MKRNIWFWLSLLVIILSACGGGTTADTAVLSSTADIDITTLAPEIDVETLAAIKDREDVLVLDVREQWEYDEGHIPGVTLIPMGEIASRMDEIPTDKEVIVTCRSGNRSGQVTEFLRQEGFDNVHNLKGGILDWQAAHLPVE